MIQWRPTLLTVALLAALGFAAWGASGLTKHVIVAVDKWGDAAPAKGATDNLVAKAAAALPDKADELAVANRVANPLIETIRQYGDLAPAARQAITDTAANINRPCRGAAGPDACGTLAEVNKTMVRAGDAIVTTQLVERASVPHVVDAMDSFRNAGLGLKQNSDDLSALLKNQAIERSMTNVASMTGSWAGISGDARTVADKATADYLKPVPWWMRPIKRGGEIIDITAAAARHLP
jgi:hypothetical protein